MPFLSIIRVNYCRVFPGFSFPARVAFPFPRAFARWAGLAAAGAAGGCLAGVLAGAGPGMAGGPYACRAGRAACGPPLVGPARPPGLARRGTRARQVGKEPTQSGTRHGLRREAGTAGGARVAVPRSSSSFPAVT